MTNHLPSTRVQEYLDGDLSPVEREAVAAHLAACSHCRSEVTAYRAIIQGAAGVGAGGGSRHGSWRDVEFRIRRRARLVRVARLAAMIALLVVPAAVLTYASGSLDPLLPYSVRTAANRPLPQEAEYRGIAARLESELMAHGRDAPEVRARVERELTRIDHRIRDVRRELHRHPGAVLLQEEMVNLHARRIRTIDSGLWLLSGG